MKVNKTDILPALAEILQQPIEKLKPNAKLQGDLGLDSLDQVELVIDVENRFSIRIDDNDIDKLLTISDLVNYIATSTPLQAADAA